MISMETALTIVLVFGAATLASITWLFVDHLAGPTLATIIVTALFVAGLPIRRNGGIK